jgi:hypothetical protein
MNQANADFTMRLSMGIFCNERFSSKQRGIEERHARANEHPLWISSFEEMTTSKQASGNLPGVIETEGQACM